MSNRQQQPDYFGNILVLILIGLLFYAGFISYKSIDWTVLKKLESDQLVLPTSIPATQSAKIAPTKAASVSSPAKN